MCVLLASSGTLKASASDVRTEQSIMVLLAFSPVVSRKFTIKLCRDANADKDTESTMESARFALQISS